ncbi:hypothetical protein MRB53_021584 [Persea americana]|uniref:Uncharacterized protein n=1 Tax=Persea americana TaxID=3435 RepID=A0ACC2L5B5_PERAE|nr:hypothetical protein MRB53_021584 [Persea americana]
MVGPMRKKSPLDPSFPPQVPSPSTSTGQPPPQLPSPTTFFTQPQPANPFPTFPAQPLPGSTKPAPTHLSAVTLPSVTLSAPSQPHNFPPLPIHPPPLFRSELQQPPPPSPQTFANLFSSPLNPPLSGISASLPSPSWINVPALLPPPSAIYHPSPPPPIFPSTEVTFALPLVPSSSSAYPSCTFQPIPTITSQAPPSTSSTSATSQNASTRKASPPSLNDLPYEVVSVILKKTPSPTIGILNPFSILDHCSFLDPALNPSIYGRNLQAFSEGNSSTELPPGFDIPSDLPTLPPVPNPSPGSAHPTAEHSSPCSISKASDPPSLHNISPTSPLATTATTDILPPNTTNTGKPGKGKKFTSPTTSIGPITRGSRAKKTSPKSPPC